MHTAAWNTRSVTKKLVICFDWAKTSQSNYTFYTYTASFQDAVTCWKNLSGYVHFGFNSFLYYTFTIEDNFSSFLPHLLPFAQLPNAWLQGF